MTKITKKAYAKINLSLDVISKLDNGYHTLETVMQKLELCDEASVSVAEKGINITCSDKSVPTDEKNTVFKAARLFFDKFNFNCGVNVHIDKRIPSQAGLGGGSSDAAAVIDALDEIFCTNLSLDDKISVGTKVGADVPFFFGLNTALCQGFGEIVTPLKSLRKYHVILVKPDFGISTPYAYKVFDDKKIVSNRSTQKLISAIESDSDISKLLSNDLEIALELKDISSIKSKLIDAGAITSMMTGSGSCVFGLFSDITIAQNAYDSLKSDYPFVYLTSTL